MRSIISKIKMLATDLTDRSCSLALLSEIWEKVDNKKHQYKIKELFEMWGLKYISTLRYGKRRGGGAAIIASAENFTITKLSVKNPHKLEVVWGLLKSNHFYSKISKIIVCSFYCPPNSKKKSVLIDHLTLTLQSLRTTFPAAAVVISGDRNSLGMDKLLSIDSSLKQIVHNHTRGQKILTVLLTDVDKNYEEPKIVPPVSVDDPVNGGVPRIIVGLLPRRSQVQKIPDDNQKLLEPSDRLLIPILKT